MSPNVGLGTGPGTRGWDLYISSIVMVILAGLFVATRLLQRGTKTHLALDDYLIAIALLASILLSITEIKAVVHGYGRRYEELTDEQAEEARKWFFGAQIVYKIVLAFAKASICHTYYRIFKVSSSKFRIACHTTQFVIVTSAIAFIVGTIFQCRPVRAFWNQSIADASCIDQTPWWMSFAIVQITTDVVILILPATQVFKLQISRTKRLGILLAFCTGLFVTFTSIYRATTLASSATNSDPTWGPIPATTWSVIEANSAIIAACLPLLRRPFVSVFNRFKDSVPTPQGRSTNTGPSRASMGVKMGPYRSLQPNNNVIEVTNHRSESEERMVGNGNIYVMQDVSVTSKDGRADSKEVGVAM